MKKILFLLNLLLAQMTYAQEQTEKLEGDPVFLETFKPVERVHDFGKIQEKDGKVSTVFTFKNTGDKVVAISDVNTWCGCMAVDYTKKPVRPGETATMKVDFDPDHKDGNFVKQVVLLLNNGKNYVRVWVKADVVPMFHPVTEDCPHDAGHGLFLNQQIVPFPNLNAGEDFTYDLLFGNNTDKPMTVTFIRKPLNTVLKMPEEVVLAPHEKKVVSLSYHFNHTYKYTSYIMVTPVVNGKQAKPFKVRWNGEQKFTFGD